MADAPIPLSPKQLKALHYSYQKINIAEGSVRSGKTHVWLYRFIAHALVNGPKSGLLMIVGKTKDTVERNAIEPLIEICRDLEIAHKYVRGSHFMLAHRKIAIVGANDKEAESKVRGSTLAGAYINEATLVQEDVFMQLIARCSLPGAKLFADTNPDSPFHWLRQKVLDNSNVQKRLFALKFKIDDNPSLDEDYKDSLKDIYSASPMLYERMINGRWVAAQGAIYDMFRMTDAPEGHVTPFLPLSFDKIAVGVDYGTATVTTFLAAGRNNGRWYIFREYYYDAEVQMKQKSNDEFADDFLDFLDGRGYPDDVGAINPRTIEVDPSASGIRVDMRRRGISQIRNADNDVIEGIRNVQDAFFQNELWIFAKCKNTIEEHAGYVWDTESTQYEKGVELPLKQHDHTCDAARYLLKRHYGRPELRAVDKPG